MSAESKDVPEPSDGPQSKAFVMRVPVELKRQIVDYMRETEQDNQSLVWRRAMTEMLARRRRRQPPPATN